MPRKPPPPGNSRRTDVERSGSPVRMPPVDFGTYLLDYLWEFGPTKGDKPIEASDLVAWEHLLGIEWKPYESRLLLRLSRAYLGESFAATKRDAECPWPDFVKQWKWVQAKKSERGLDAFLK